MEWNLAQCFSGPVEWRLQGWKWGVNEGRNESSLRLLKVMLIMYRVLQHNIRTPPNVLLLSTDGKVGDDGAQRAWVERACGVLAGPLVIPSPDRMVGVHSPLCKCNTTWGELGWTWDIHRAVGGECNVQGKYSYACLMYGVLLREYSSTLETPSFSKSVFRAFQACSTPVLNSPFRTFWGWEPALDATSSWICVFECAKLENQFWFVCVCVCVRFVAKMWSLEQVHKVWMTCSTGTTWCASHERCATCDDFVKTYKAPLPRSRPRLMI